MLRKCVFNVAIVTRSKKRLFQSMNIKDCFVALKRDRQAESLMWLNMTANPVNGANAANIRNVSNTQQQNEQSTGRTARRRASVASTNLFSVANSVREVGFDFLQRISRSNAVQFGRNDADSHIDDTVNFTLSNYGKYFDHFK